MHAIFRNPDTIVSQITTTTVESKVIGFWKELIWDSNSVKKNPERWDFTPSPKKDQIAYTIFGNPFNMAERGRELDRRERGEIHVENEEEEQVEIELRP